MTSFDVLVSFQGKSARLTTVTTATTCAQIVQSVREALQLSHDTPLKVLYKGKNLASEPETALVFSESATRKPPKLLVMASSQATVQEIQSKRSDPTIRGFDNEKKKPGNDASAHDPFWGTSGQDRNYKFVRLEACTSFHNATQEAPHTFQAMRLLEKLSTDPGIVAVMKERELVVNTLGEMDPVDDRLMQKKEAQGACLLGYNTNHGLRIDVRLRSHDLQSFLPYPQIVATLIHEISHNWFGSHDLYFWTNYGQMRAEYLHTHYHRTATIWEGKTSAQIAELPRLQHDGIPNMILGELEKEMAQHRLHPNMIAPAITQRCRELQESTSRGSRVGGADFQTDGNQKSARELALEAAERRARENGERGRSSNSKKGP